MKRVICLYRVSTVGQVDHDDIPMQKKACREYVEQHPDWEIVDEISEKGVSGYKVSTNARDAIVEIKKQAITHQFDVLLVFMFDCLGRRDDETPFVVCARLRHVAGTQWGNKKYMSMKHLETLADHASVG